MPMSFDSSSRNAIKDEQNKQQIIEAINAENDRFNKLTEAYYSAPQHSKEEYQQYFKEMLTIIDRILAAGDWEVSLFLRNTVKPLKKVKEEIVALQSQFENKLEEEDIAPLSISEGKQLIYLLLYQADGNNLKKWEQLIRTLPRYVQGRPIYESEEHVKKSIRSKLDTSTEAYAVILIDKKNVLPITSGVISSSDRLEQPLVTLRENTVALENILEFVHLNKRYRFQRGKLVLRS